MEIIEIQETSIRIDRNRYKSLTSLGVGTLQNTRNEHGVETKAAQSRFLAGKSDFFEKMTMSKNPEKSFVSKKSSCGRPHRQKIAFKYIPDYSQSIPNQFPYIKT